MGLVGYSGMVLGSIVDIGFRNVIRFYSLQYNALPKVDTCLWSWTLTVR